MYDGLYHDLNNDPDHVDPSLPIRGAEHTMHRTDPDKSKQHTVQFE